MQVLRLKKTMQVLPLKKTMQVLPPKKTMQVLPFEDIPTSTEIYQIHKIYQITKICKIVLGSSIPLPFILSCSSTILLILGTSEPRLIREINSLPDSARLRETQTRTKKQTKERRAQKRKSAHRDLDCHGRGKTHSKRKHREGKK